MIVRFIKPAINGFVILSDSKIMTNEKQKNKKIKHKRLFSLVLATHVEGFKRLSFILMFVLSFISGVSSYARAHPPATSEQEVKAAFLYNFVRFVNWPEGTLPQSDKSFIIGLLGGDPLAPALASIIEGKTINGRRLIIKRFRSIRDLNTCQILFIGSSGKTQFQQILTRVKNLPVLTVADTDGFAAAGGMINFIIVKKKIRFEINQQAAEKVKLKISSKLLKLAKIVHPK